MTNQTTIQEQIKTNDAKFVTYFPLILIVIGCLFGEAISRQCDAIFERSVSLMDFLRISNIGSHGEYIRYSFSFYVVTTATSLLLNQHISFY